MSQARQTSGHIYGQVEVGKTREEIVLRCPVTQDLVLVSSLGIEAFLVCLHHGSMLASHCYRRSWLHVGDGGCSDC